MYEPSSTRISCDNRVVPPADKSIMITTIKAYFKADPISEVELLKTSFLFKVKLITEESTLASIVKVELSNDLSYCKVYITVYGSDEEKENTFIGLEKAKGFIKRQLSGMVKMRKMPEITFVPDDSIAYSIHISEILNKINEEK